MKTRTSSARRGAAARNPQPALTAIAQSPRERPLDAAATSDPHRSATILAAPSATFRLQLHKDFTFADAQAQLPYLAKLGVSHVYLSPILTARAGSMHGYDIVDHGSINPELGGEEGFRGFVASARRHALGIIVDIVPNHMAIGNSDNRLWLDVLEWGRNSRYANFFDIDWEVPDPVLKNKILAPFLGNAYGDVLAQDQIQLHFDATSGRLFAQYFEHRFPIKPSNYAQVLRLGGSALAAIAKRFRVTCAQPISRRGEDFSDVCAELVALYADDNAARNALDTLLQRFQGGSENSRSLLHQLLERQHYRLSSWRNAADEINWRRFFDVIQLAGIRIQEPAAFEVVHATIFRLYAEGLIDGLRIDHIDGLADPRAYCRRLRARLNRLARERPPTAPGGAAYFIVEKILAPEERLPREWRVDGTTGYSFMNDVSALLHDAGGEQALATLWTQLSGRRGDFERESQAARRRILQELLAAEFNSCALALHRIARSDPLTRDWSLLAIRRVLEELLVQFPIYRTYADARGRSSADDLIMQQALAAARPHCRSADAPLLDLLNRWLGGEAPAQTPPRGRRARLRAIARFQQLSSPLAAKSVEDTAFYRHGKLLSRNEVGSNPALFAKTPAEFHAECARRARLFPNALLATATHDHKRGEDVRARLAVLSEIPERWAEAVRRWRILNQLHKTASADATVDADAALPLNGDEYMLYQMLAGAWPLELRPDDARGLQQFGARLQQWWLKALREAKQLSSWGEPNTAYESACQTFLDTLLDPGRSAAFLAELFAFVESIAAAGAINGLSQTLLKLTTPGIPDIYQGTELWDFSLVDPDNRRPVDYPLRSELLAAGTTPAALCKSWRSGAIKQHLIARLLQFRRTHPELFAAGAYQPVHATGKLSEHVFAFTRRWRDTTLIVAAVRLPAHLQVAGAPFIPPSHWAETELIIPKDFSNESMSTRRLCNLLVETDAIPLTRFIRCSDLFAHFPFAVLVVTE